MSRIQRLSSEEPEFFIRLETLLAWDSASDARVERTVSEIVRGVRERGDPALLEYTKRFDGWEPEGLKAPEIPIALLEKSVERIDPTQRRALETAAQRIRSYAERQKLESWSYTEADGTVHYAPPALCTDNGAMIAFAGHERLTAGHRAPLAIHSRARWPMDELPELGDG